MGVGKSRVLGTVQHCNTELLIKKDTQAKEEKTPDVLYLIQNDVQVKGKGCQSVCVAQHWTDWAAWNDKKSPGVPGFARKPPLGAAPKWKGRTEDFSGTGSTGESPIHKLRYYYVPLQLHYILCQ